MSYQDLLILACGHPENRSSLTRMDEWPEWILEILISNHEVAALTHIMADIDICIGLFCCAISHTLFFLCREVEVKI